MSRTLQRLFLLNPLLPEKCFLEEVSLTVAGTTAVALVRDDYIGKRFLDTLSFKCDRWVIAISYSISKAAPSTLLGSTESMGSPLSCMLAGPKEMGCSLNGSGSPSLGHKRQSPIHSCHSVSKIWAMSASVVFGLTTQKRNAGLPSKRVATTNPSPEARSFSLHAS